LLLESECKKYYKFSKVKTIKTLGKRAFIQATRKRTLFAIHANPFSKPSKINVTNILFKTKCLFGLAYIA